MGCGGSTAKSEEEGGASPTQLAESAKIEQALQAEQDDEKRTIKCLLLGAGECGKSTILKQMRILHLNGFQSPEERQTYKLLIHKNTIDVVQSLCAAMNQLTIAYETPGNAVCAEKMLAIQVNNLSSIDTVQLAGEMKALWADPGCQRCITRSNEWHLLDSAEYFIKNCDRFFSPGYDPSEQDILRSRLSTTGIIETLFKLDKLTFKMYDVGGQRGERKKWIHCFDSVTAIMFIASLSEYDQVLSEDRTRNRMKESMDLFEGINNLPWFRDIPIILFLNKGQLHVKQCVRNMT